VTTSRIVISPYLDATTILLLWYDKAYVMLSNMTMQEHILHLAERPLITFTIVRALHCSTFEAKKRKEKVGEQNGRYVKESF